MSLSSFSAFCLTLLGYWCQSYWCNFSKSISGGGAQRVICAQGTIKILMKSDFSSDLNLVIIIGGLAEHWGAQPNVGATTGHPQRDVKLRPWSVD